MKQALLRQRRLHGNVNEMVPVDVLAETQTTVRIQVKGEMHTREVNKSEVIPVTAVRRRSRSGGRLVEKSTRTSNGTSIVDVTDRVPDPFQRHEAIVARLRAWFARCPVIGTLSAQWRAQKRRARALQSLLAPTIAGLKPFPCPCANIEIRSGNILLTVPLLPLTLMMVEGAATAARELALI